MVLAHSLNEKYYSWLKSQEKQMAFTKCRPFIQLDIFCMYRGRGRERESIIIELLYCTLHTDNNRKHRLTLVFQWLQIDDYHNGSAIKDGCLSQMTYVCYRLLWLTISLRWANHTDYKLNTIIIMIGTFSQQRTLFPLYLFNVQRSLITIMQHRMSMIEDLDTAKLW